MNAHVKRFEILNSINIVDSQKLERERHRYCNNEMEKEMARNINNPLTGLYFICIVMTLSINRIFM